VTRWRTARLAAGVSVATVNRDLAALRSVVTYAFDQELLDTHPLAKLKFPKVKVEEGVVRYLSAVEEKHLRDALASRDHRRRLGRERANEWRRRRRYAPWPAFGPYTDHLTPIVLLALNTGLRRGELLQLEWRDVELDRATLTVRGDVAKSRESRVVPLNSEAIATLKAWQPAEDADRVVSIQHRRRHARGLVFPGEDGERMGGLKTAFLGILRAAKVDRFRFHDLRHSFASKLVMAGVDLNTVRELLGHADLKMTLRYAHLAPEHKAAAVAKLVTA
jgi:integrase